MIVDPPHRDPQRIPVAGCMRRLEQHPQVRGLALRGPVLARERQRTCGIVFDEQPKARFLAPVHAVATPARCVEPRGDFCAMPGESHLPIGKPLFGEREPQ